MTTTSVLTVNSTSTTTTTIGFTSTTVTTAYATETVLLSRTGQYQSPVDNSTFYVYPGTGFAGYDLAGCPCSADTGTDSCNAGGAIQARTCNTFDDCLDVCAAINVASGYNKCVGIAFGTDEYGNCYPKYAVPGNGAPGCGVIQPYHIDSAAIKLD
jgi:hypothetical protein